MSALAQFPFFSNTQTHHLIIAEKSHFSSYTKGALTKTWFYYMDKELQGTLSKGSHGLSPA